MSGHAEKRLILNGFLGVLGCQDLKDESVEILFYLWSFSDHT